MKRLASFLVIPWLITGCAVARFESVRTEKQTIETQSADDGQPTEPLARLDLYTFNGTISVQSHDSPEISMAITYKAHGDTQAEAKQNVETLKCDYAVKEGVLVIKVIKPPSQWQASAAFELLVPHDCALKLATSNGAVKVIDLAAKVEASTSNGGIELTDIEGDVSARTSNGRVTLVRCRGTTEIKTSNGKVEYSGWLVGTENKIQTSNGSVVLALDGSVATAVEANTSNGSIKCSMPDQKIIDESKKYFHAIVGGGDSDKQAKVYVNTSNGSVLIDPIVIEVETGETEQPQAEIGSVIAI